MDKTIGRISHFSAVVRAVNASECYIFFVEVWVVHKPGLVTSSTSFLGTSTGLVIALNIKLRSFASFTRRLSSRISGSLNTLRCEIQEVALLVIIDLIEEEVESV